MKPVAPVPVLPAPPSSRPVMDTLGRLDSKVLLGAKGEVEILHDGETYRLRRTRQGKLILTK